MYEMLKKHCSRCFDTAPVFMERPAFPEGLRMVIFLLEGARASQFYWQTHSAPFRKPLSSFMDQVIPRMPRALAMDGFCSQRLPPLLRKGKKVAGSNGASFKPSVGPGTSFPLSYFNCPTACEVGVILALILQVRTLRARAKA